MIVDDKLMQEARRCREMWHSLQELGGIHNSHAERLLARERKAWEEQAQAAAAPRAANRLDGRERRAVAPRRRCAAAAAAAEAAREASSDEPYIETARCTTLQRVHADQRQDVRLRREQAGLHQGIRTPAPIAQLVEAAESCQVSIIHPGKPRNPNEPGLDELIKRAEPFL